MDVFGAAEGEAGTFLRDAAIAAAHDIGVFEVLGRGSCSFDDLARAVGCERGLRRLRALVELLVGIGAVGRVLEQGGALPGDFYYGDDLELRGTPRPRPDVPREGWGLLADVIRSDRPLPLPGGESEARMHAHLAEAGAAVARELFEKLRDDVLWGASHIAGAPSLLDLGGGAGAYTAAFLDANPDGVATLVDYAEVIALAREHLARFADRVRFVVSDIRTAHVGTGVLGEHDIVLLANVLHLHGEVECAQICAVAARAVKPGGRIVVKDLRIDDDRSGPIEGLLFALNMAVYTGAGSVYPMSYIRSWFAAAGIEEIEERRFDVAPDAFAIIGRRPRAPSEEAIEAECEAIASQLSRVGKIAWRELVAAGTLRAGAQPRHLQFPGAFARTLARALLTSREDARAARANEGYVAALSRAANMTAPETVEALSNAIATRRAGEESAMRNHYLETLPRGRVAQMVGTDEPAATFMHAPLEWAQLPRMSAAIDRLFGVLGAAGVDATTAVGVPTADAFRVAASTFGELFMRTHYGACMPLLYGYPADLAYFAARGRERGESTLATMDRYLTAPLIHELCHFGRDRDALPTHLDECIGGWLGVHVWPEFMIPQDGRDDAIPHAPLLAQVGQAFARSYGVDAIVRAQSGQVTWRDTLGEHTLASIEALCWEDWRERRTVHFLSDTLNPRPWVALGLAAGAGHWIAVHTMRSLDEQLQIGQLALRADDAFDCAIVSDAVHAMCLVTEVIEGSMRTRFALPTEPIRIDPRTCLVSCADREYWLPPEVAGRMLAAGRRNYELRVSRRDAIPDAVAAICAASAGNRSGWVLAGGSVVRAWRASSS